MATQNWFRSLQSDLSLSVASPGTATMTTRRDAQIKPKMGLEEGLAKKTEMAEHLAFLQRKQFLESRQTRALAEDARSGLVRGGNESFPETKKCHSQRERAQMCSLQRAQM